MPATAETTRPADDRSVAGLWLGLDTGGTFTDAVLLGGGHHVIASAKALTTPWDLSIGIGGAIRAVLAAPEPAHIELFSAGVEPANAGSVGCLRKAGFEPLDPEPDWEGVVYYSRLRHPATSEAPTVPRQPPR